MELPENRTTFVKFTNDKHKLLQLIHTINNTELKENWKMACTTGLNPECNAFIKGKDELPTVTIYYGFYVNWGRPNYNTNRVSIIRDALVGMGYSIQMKIDEAHSDFVSLMLNDEVVCKMDDMQHNRNYRSLRMNSEELVDQFVEATAK